MTDTNKLKRVAERLGYDARINDTGWVYIFHYEPEIDHIKEEFNPYANPAQLVECIKWLLKHGWGYNKTGSYYQVWHEGQDILVLAETLAEAVINAIAGGQDES